LLPSIEAHPPRQITKSNTAVYKQLPVAACWLPGARCSLPGPGGHPAASNQRPV